MGLEKVRDRVLAEAKQKAESRMDAARAEAKQILNLAKKQAAEQEKTFKEMLAEEVEMTKKREAATAILEIKKLNLAFRKEHVDSIFEEVKKRLEKLSESRRASHVKSLLKKADKELDVSTIYCNKKDVKHVNTKYVIEESDILGGLIAESKDKTLRVDYSYETLIRQLENSLTPEINKILFAKK